MLAFFLEPTEYFAVLTLRFIRIPESIEPPEFISVACHDRAFRAIVMDVVPGENGNGLDLRIINRFDPGGAQEGLGQPELVGR